MRSGGPGAIEGVPMSGQLPPTRSHRSRTAVIACAIGLALISGCSSSASKGTAATEPTATSTSDTVVAETSTTVTPETTVAATTTAAPTTTEAPALAPLTLRGDGVGSFDLGMSYTDVSAGLTAQLEATTDEALEFPMTTEYGGYVTTDESRGFIAPFGRIACWSDGATGELCAAFGGADPALLTFVGWTYGGSTLRTTSGVTGGSLWSEFPTMITPGQGGCFLNSSGSIDGVLVSVVSAGATFGSYDDAGNFVPGDPNPADVSVIGLDDGDFPFDTNADC